MAAFDPKKDKVHVRLWGDTAYCSEAEEKRTIKKVAKEFGVKPEMVEIERMTKELVAATYFAEKKSKRGGVDGGTGKTAETEDE